MLCRRLTLRSPVRTLAARRHRLHSMASTNADVSPKWPAGNSRILLGSSSYSRQGIMQELAQQYGFQYDTVTADIDEQALGDRASDPAQLVALLAQAKAAAICERLREQRDTMQGFLLTCDQVVVYQGVIREKPVSAQQAKEFIHGYSEHPAGTVGCTICTVLESGQAYSAVDMTWTHFKPIPAETVDKVVQEGTVMKCAGALMIENPLLAPCITSFEGTKDAIMGLSKETVLRLLSLAVNAAEHEVGS